MTECTKKIEELECLLRSLIPAVSNVFPGRVPPRLPVRIPLYKIIDAVYEPHRVAAVHDTLKQFGIPSGIELWWAMLGRNSWGVTDVEVAQGLVGNAGNSYLSPHSDYPVSEGALVTIEKVATVWLPPDMWDEGQTAVLPERRAIVPMGRTTATVNQRHFTYMLVSACRHRRIMRGDNV